jgi:hypothetical protein
MPIRALNNVYIPLFNPLHRVVGVNANFMRPVTVIVESTDADEGTVTFQSVIHLVDDSCGSSLPEVDPVPFAHGFQPDDIVTIEIVKATASTLYSAVVSEIVDATTFMIEIGSLPTSIFTDADIQNICVGLKGTPILNLYFGSICNTALRKGIKVPANIIKHEILGFNETAYQWNGPTSLPIFATSTYSFDPPSYLLVEMLPSGSTYISHTYKNQTLTNLLSK